MPIEDEVRRSLHRRVDSVDAAPEPPQGPSPGPRGNAARVATIVFALLIGAASVAFLIAHPWSGTAPGSPSASTATPSGSATSSPPPGWIRQTNTAAGVSIDTPVSWYFNSDPVPNLVYPGILFAVGTGPAVTGGDCGPTAALHTLPKDGTLFVLYEYNQGDPKQFPPRPAALQLGGSQGPIECWGVDTYSMQFQDQGRFFQVRVVFGPNAPLSLHDEVIRSLESLQVVAGVTPTLAPNSPPIATHAVRCKVGDLLLGMGGPVSEATGQHSRMLSFTKQGQAACSLFGYPRISVLDAAGAPIPFLYIRSGDQMVTSRPPTTVVLAPGAVAFAMINKYRCDRRDVQAGKSIVVGFPWARGALTVGVSPPGGNGDDFSFCGQGDPGSVISISPFEPTEAATSAH
jgi:hypothetical protein